MSRQYPDCGHTRVKAVELPLAEVLPELELDFGPDDDSLLDYSDEHSSVAEDM